SLENVGSGHLHRVSDSFLARHAHMPQFDEERSIKVRSNDVVKLLLRLILEDLAWVEAVYHLDKRQLRRPAFQVPPRELARRCQKLTFQPADPLMDFFCLVPDARRVFPAKGGGHDILDGLGCLIYNLNVSDLRQHYGPQSLDESDE